MLVFTTRRVRPTGITAPRDPAFNLQKYKKLKISKYTIQKNTNTIHIEQMRVFTSRTGRPTEITPPREPAWNLQP